jgi:heat shock protein HtpX
MTKRVHFDEIRSNNIKSIFLFIMFMFLIVAIGSVTGYIYGNIYFGLIISAVIGVVYSIIVWFAGASILLKLSKARPVTKQEFPHLYHSVEGLAIAAGIPTPKAYVIDSEALNAFATGRNYEEGAVVVTTGLINKLSREELEGVLAHEISHIKNYDIRSMMIAAIMTGVVVIMSDFLLRSFIFGSHRNRNSGGGKGQIIGIIIAVVLAILAPLIAQMIKLAISRKREYAADAGAAVLTRYPQGIANALRKISMDTHELTTATKATAHMYINSPFKKKSFMKNLFSTHPDVGDRIKRLEEM